MPRETRQLCSKFSLPWGKEVLDPVITIEFNLAYYFDLFESFGFYANKSDPR